MTSDADLLDHFAGIALSALIQSQVQPQLTRKERCLAAYRYANDMLVARDIHFGIQKQETTGTSEEP